MATKEGVTTGFAVHPEWEERAERLNRYEALLLAQEVAKALQALSVAGNIAEEAARGGEFSAEWENVVDRAYTSLIEEVGSVREDGPMLQKTIVSTEDI